MARKDPTAADAREDGDQRSEANQHPRDSCRVCGRSFRQESYKYQAPTCSICFYQMHQHCSDAVQLEVPQRIRDRVERFEGIKQTYALGNYYPPICDKCWENLRASAFKKAVYYYQSTGRVEELAQLYEDYAMPEQAEAVRGKDRLRAVENGKVDLNGLIGKLRRGRLSVPVRCPSCGAGFTVDGRTDPARLALCPHCGAALGTDMIAKVLEEALEGQQTR